MSLVALDARAAGNTHEMDIALIREHTNCRLAIAILASQETAWFVPTLRKLANALPNLAFKVGIACIRSRLLPSDVFDGQCFSRRTKQRETTKTPKRASQVVYLPAVSAYVLLSGECVMYER